MTELVLVGAGKSRCGTESLLLVVSAGPSAQAVSASSVPRSSAKTWLPGLASGTSKMVFAITEPDAGNHRLSTTAVRDGDDWVLNGTKYYISGVDEAEALLVVAKTGQDALSIFIVPTDAAGFGSTCCRGIRSRKRSSPCTSTTYRRRPGRWSARGAGFRQVFHGLNPERITAPPWPSAWPGNGAATVAAR